MTKIDKPYFKCDFCGKKQFRECDMAKHEKWCKKNPKNEHTCFQHCKHLIKSEEEYEGVSYDGEYEGKRTVFTCAVNSQKMFSFIAERRNLPVIKEPNTIRMPLDCDKYKAMYADDFSYGLEIENLVIQ